MNRQVTLATAIFAAAAMLLLTASAQAALVTWDNGGSGERWGTDNNWNPDGEPDQAQDSVLFTTGFTNVVEINQDVNLASGQTFTLNADTRIKLRGSNDLTFDDADQLQGSGLLTLDYVVWGPPKAVISAAQPNFTGGFALTHTKANRHIRLIASVADAMGTGAASGTGFSQFNYTWGAQSIVGGVTAGVTVGNDAVINLQGTGPIGGPSPLRERFTVNNRGILAGNATQLGYLTRVSSFSASPTGAEVILADGAVIVPTDYDATPGVANLGTDADLLYGITGTLNNAGFTLNVGAGTPWKGLSTEANRNQSGTGWSEDKLRKGTVVIDDGGGTFTELLLNAPGGSYSAPRVGHLLLGQGSDAPALTSAVSSGPVGLRTELGYVHVNSPNLDLSGIDSWTIENGARLVLDYALPGDDTNLADLIGLILESGAAVELTGEDTYVNALTLGGVSYDPGTYDNTTDGAYIKGTGSITVIPEPATLALLGLGGLMMVGRRRRRA